MRTKVCSLLVLLPAIAMADAKPPPLLAEVQAHYAKVPHLTGTFTQTITNSTFGKADTSRGTLYLARPDKMRWRYIDKKQKLKRDVIYDSKTLWVVEAQNKQVLRHATASATLPAAISFLNGGDKLASEFTVSAPKADTLELVPKQTNAKIKKLTFVVDPKTKAVVRSIVVDHNDDTNTFDFAGIDTSKKPDPKLFRFSPKSVPTYTVVDVK